MSCALRICAVEVTQLEGVEGLAACRAGCAPLLQLDSTVITQQDVTARKKPGTARRVHAEDTVPAVWKFGRCRRSGRFLQVQDVQKPMQGREQLERNIWAYQRRYVYNLKGMDAVILLWRIFVEDSSSSNIEKS